MFCDLRDFRNGHKTVLTAGESTGLETAESQKQ